MRRRIFINGASALSIQDTLTGFAAESFVEYRQRFVPAKDPDFKEFIPPMVARRMSRIIKRAVTVSHLALREAGITTPDAIVFGTGLGCIEDTEKFLNAVLDQDEQFLQPSFFIQSTHNTIASQVAIRLSCHGYNNTLVQRRLSFESALLDTCMLLEGGEINTALTGGHDELTPSYFTLLNKAGYYSYDEASASGSFAGEGSSSFVLCSEKQDNSYALIQAVELPYIPGRESSFGTVALPFLAKHGIAQSELGAIFTAYTEDDLGRHVYRDLETHFAGIPHIPYKAICGEYFTASAFGFWLAAHYLRSDHISGLRQSPYILLHNHSQNKHHSLILLRGLKN